MRRHTGRVLIIAALVVLGVLILGRAAAMFYTDLLWYDAVGQAGVFWKRLLTTAAVRAITGALGAVIILANLSYLLRHLGPVHLRRRYGNLEIAEQVPRSYLMAGSLLVAVLAGWWLSTLQFGGNAPIAMLAWLQRESWGLADPLFGHDVSFYVFGLPLYIRLVEYVLILLVWSVLLVGVGYVLIGAVRARGTRMEMDDRPRMHFAVLVACIIAVLGARYLLGRYQLLLDGYGFGGSLGYTDVHARLPARLVIGVLAFAVAGALVYGARRRSWMPPAAAVGLFLLAAVGMGAIYPAVVQKVHVEPNQLAREVGYIRWNMEFTRRAYGLDRIDRRAFRFRRADADVWAAMAPVLDRLALWDPVPLQTALNDGGQARFEYYQFPDVDYDRYGPPGDRQQVAIAVREFRREGMPETARTWSNHHLNPIYTRGMGVVVTPAAEARRADPVYWLGDVFPVQRSADAPPGLELAEPSIYFGETMRDYAVVGQTGTFAREAAEVEGRLPPVPRVETGVQLSSFARVLAFAWRFGDQNLLFARELSDTSRLIFRRRVGERVATLAPFLLWDPDPHPVVVDGRVVWIIDGYTASSNYPLSRPQPIPDVGTLRYMRGSVKAVLDAVTGEVAIYILPDPDPILRTYRRVFPGLMRDWDEMPAAIQSHLRYPSLLFRVQSTVLEQYHLERPEAFYAGQDVWQLPQDVSPQTRRRFRPDFVMAPLPGEGESEFLLLNPFIARGRQNMTALLAARSDAPNYGQMVLFEMPRDDQIRGPAQVQSIIEQDPFVSQQLSLWRQQGSNVEMGRMRVIPSAESILYIEPLFLAARERGIPQLQRVIVSDGVAVAMAEDLRAAVVLLAGETVALQRMERTSAGPAEGDAAPDGTPDAWRQQALVLMREADERLRAGDFAGFGLAWTRLRALLEQRGEGGMQQ
ncbi:MAG TPA: UPF0182 family protein [Longimicrobiales bacterium]|nr:UPF0182 family protein [Longimicrobiales bacterium]